MKRNLLLLLLIVMSLSIFGTQSLQLGSTPNGFRVIASTETETHIQYNIGSFENRTVIINGETYQHISLGNEGISQEKGYPELPVFNRSIIIPASALMQIDVYDIEYRDIDMKVAPSKGVITRDQNPEKVPYTFGTAYAQNLFYPAAIATLSEPYIMRDYRGITIRTNPFAYNPAAGILRVYTSFKVRVFASGSDSTNILNGQRASIERAFLPIYQNHFINYEAYRYTPVNDSYGKLLVICHTNYMTQILPYVNWKRQKGIETELIQWSTIGTTAAQLQTYIQNRYNADNSIAYIQLVGDAPQIPTLSSGGGGSDPSFSLVAGSDNYPDIFIGRFSAETTAQVTAQINKAIVYERDLTTSATWLSRAMGIASSEGGGSQGDNGESDIAHMNIIRTKLMNYGYSSVDQVYDPGATAATVSTNVNAGRGFINYVGHGSDTSWVTSGFNSTNATNLTNGSMTPVIMDVACVNGNFVSITCFAEAWMRNANGGAVTIYASTINQSWNSPMRAQDEFTDLLIAEQKFSAGGLYYNSSCKMMDIYGNTTGSDGVNMFKTWTIFGDASLLVRSKTPQAMTVNHPASIILGANTINVSTGVANALIALTHNNTIYARGYTNSSGNAVLTLVNAPQTALDYTITATAFNKVTYIGSISQIVGNGPFLAVNNVNYTDTNNSTPEYHESGSFAFTVQNIGVGSAPDVIATLSSNSPVINISQSTMNLGTIAAGGNINIPSGFLFQIANGIVNGSSAAFSIQLVSGSDTWNHDFSISLAAPAYSFGTLSITEIGGNGNGQLDPGETATISLNLLNTGAASGIAGTAFLSGTTNGISIITSEVSFPAISAGGSHLLSFQISASSSMSAGSIATLAISAIAGAYNASSTIEMEVGAPNIVQIGSGTAAQSYPLDRYYNYSSHESLYLASEIGMSGSIKSIGFFKNTGTDLADITSVSIYMKHSDALSMSTGTYSLSGYTLVYSGSVPNNSASGWMEVNLSPRFSYNGIQNLNVLIIKGNQAWISAYPTYRYTTSSVSRARQARSDDAQPTSLTSSTYLPNLRLSIFADGSTQYFAPPQNLSASGTHQRINLSWQAPINGNPISYKVFRNSSLIHTGTALTYADINVQNGTQYSYFIKAVYSAGESDASNTVSATPSANAPTNLSATAGNGFVNLSWTAASGRDSEDAERQTRAISSYRIYRNGTALTTVTGLSHLDNSVTNEVSYTYYVTTIYTDPAGESAPSASVQAMPTAQVPANVTLGSGTAFTGTSEASPVNIWYKSLHGQSVYTAAELNAAGVYGPIQITQLGFYTQSAPLYAMPNFVIRMKHCSAINSASWQSATDMIIVYQNSSYMPVTGSYHMLALSTPFTWNGVDNLVVDTAFGLLANYNQSGSLQYTSVTNGYIATRSDTVDQTNVFSGGTVSAYRPNIRFSFEAAPSPYPSQPRYVAEFEKAKGALIRYPVGIPYTLVRELATDDLLYVIVSSTNQSAANSAFVSNSVNMNNVRWIIANTDSYWTRDYGPWFVFDDAGDLKIVDFTYNRPRPSDNAIPSVIANHLGLGYYNMPLTHTGGNIMSDGRGMAASTTLVQTENSSQSLSQINANMQNYLGVTDYQLFTDPNSTYIGHIDCWAKLLDVDKVIIRSVPSSHAQYAQIEAVAADFASRTSSWGTPYRIFRVYTPSDEPYSNAFILNNKIIVPQTGSVNDAAALQTYRNAMPGYSVIGMTGSWLSTDAIHCRVNSIPDEEMVFVNHIPLQNIASNQNISLDLAIRSNITIDSSLTRVAYRHSSISPWQYASVTQSANNLWQASISTPEYGDTLFYAITATNTAGKSSSIPLCGELDPFKVVANQVGNLVSPVLMLQKDQDSVMLAWNPIPGAVSYKVLFCDIPDGNFVQMGVTNQNTYQVLSAPARGFYRIIASTDNP